MSKCISRQGEYSEHVTNDQFSCDRCFAFDEDLALAEIKGLRAELVSYRENFPCDGGCNENNGPMEECSLHGRAPSDLWQIIGRLSAVKS